MTTVEEQARRALNELEFIKLLEQVLPDMLGAQVITSPKLGFSRPDFLAMWPNKGKEAVIEVKSITPNTRTRLRGVVEQLHRYASLYEDAYPRKPKPELGLVVPGTFTQAHVSYLHDAGVGIVIDGIAIRAAAGDTILASLMAETVESQPGNFQSMTMSLLDRLDFVKPGREDWTAYQTLCGDILSFLLCPPLSQPLAESSNLSRINRRDFIFPNYASSGFWEYLRSHYQAHFVVVDAKNYVGNVKKNEILQIANYLNSHGAGQFGVIASRAGGVKSAELTRREQWIIHRKMIILLNDDDLRQMLRLKATGVDPSDLIRQKIEDFRLGF